MRQMGKYTNSQVGKWPNRQMAKQTNLANGKIDT